MEKEIWKNINNYTNYEISNFGRVRSSKYREPRILKPRKSKNGYLYINLSRNGEYKSFNIHRLVAETFMGKSDLTVNHIDENKNNNNLSNLEFVSSKENKEKYRKNNPFYISGEKNKNSKLKKEDIKNIIFMRNGGKTFNEISIIYGVSRNCIMDVFYNRTWKEIIR